MPIALYTVNSSLNTNTPISTAVNGSSAPKREVSVGPANLMAFTRVMFDMAVAGSANPRIYNQVMPLVSRPSRTTHHTQQRRYRMTTNDILKRLCGNIAAGRFNWRKYCTPQSYFGWEICVTPLHCSYGQIGYTVHFPYTNIPEVEYDWEMGKLTIDGEKWKSYLRNE